MSESLERLYELQREHADVYRQLHRLESEIRYLKEKLGLPKKPTEGEGGTIEVICLKAREELPQRNDSPSRSAKRLRSRHFRAVLDSQAVEARKLRVEILRLGQLMNIISTAHPEIFEFNPSVYRPHIEGKFYRWLDRSGVLQERLEAIEGRKA